MAEGARLESVYTGNRIVGSNPTPSANVPSSVFQRCPEIAKIYFISDSCCPKRFRELS